MIDNEAKKFELMADYFQRIGSRHAQNYEENQDVVLCWTCFPISIYGIADGQSNKLFSKLGGKLSLQAATEYITKHGIEKLSQAPYKDEIRFHIMTGIRSLLHEKAQENQVSIHELASTLVLLAVDLRSGQYMIIHLGDGVMIGVDKGIGANKDEDAIQILSPPENGMTLRSTWLTTSESALNHLRLCFGNVGDYQRIILASDGADSVCRGSNVSHRARKLLISGSRSDVGDFVRGTSYIDDCSVCIIDICPMHDIF